MRRRQQSFVTSVHTYSGGGGGVGGGEGVSVEMFLDAVLHQCGRPADLRSLFSAWNVDAELFLEERHICSVQSLFEFSLCATDFIPTLIVQLQNGLPH